MSGPHPGAVVSGAVGLLLVAGVLAGCGTTPPPPAPSPAAGQVTGSNPRVIRVSVAHGAVSGDTGRVDVARGSAVELDVTSDVADQVHLHGYDEEADVPAGGTATLRFQADLPGVFEVELHGSDTRLLRLEIA